jgi:RNA polymerase sigma-70 factor (ECF subfamily)
MDNYTELPDLVLIQLTKEGDQLAFSHIYERYWGMLFIHARKILGNEEEAKDIVQNLFFSLYTNISHIDFKTTLSFYLYRSVKNMVLDHIKHQKIVDRYLESFSNFSDHGALITDQEIRRKELEKIIEQGIDELPGKMKEVFVLSRRENMSHKEIAEKLGITQHTIKSQISNAIRILRNKIGACLMLF